MKFSLKGNKGFSLVELMIVVGIIGILASLAMPRLQVFMAKARQAEARTNLGAMATLIESYKNESSAGTYIGATTGTIGFQQPAGAKYVYTLPVPTATTYLATGTAAANALCNGSPVNVATLNELRVFSIPTPTCN